jgi:hypothetical protein
LQESIEDGGRTDGYGCCDKACRDERAHDTSPVALQLRRK